VIDKIDIVTTCGVNSVDYAGFLAWSISETASNSERFRLLLGVNDASVDVDALCRAVDFMDFTIIDAVNDIEYSSISHGMSLDVTFAHVSTEKFIICDVDVAFLAQDWDLLLEQQIDDHDNVAVGASYRWGYLEKNGHEKHHGFPNIYASMAVTKLVRDCGVSFMPDAQNKTMVVTDENAQFCGLIPGQLLFCDTGWEFSYKLREAGHRGQELTVHTADSPDVKVLLAGQRGDEFHLGGIPIVTHIGRSFYRPLKHNSIAIGWERCVRRWISSSDG
jgi:hypothetical protein